MATMSKSPDPTVEFLALWSSKFLSVMETGSNTGTQKIAVYRQMKKAASKYQKQKIRAAAERRSNGSPPTNLNQKVKVRLRWDTQETQKESLSFLMRDRKRRKLLNQIQPVFLDQIFTNKFTEWNVIKLHSLGSYFNKQIHRLKWYQTPIFKITFLQTNSHNEMVSNSNLLGLCMVY